MFTDTKTLILEAPSLYGNTSECGAKEANVFMSAWVICQQK